MICLSYLQSLNQYHYLRVYGVFNFWPRISHNIASNQGTHLIVNEDCDHGIHWLYHILHRAAPFWELECPAGGIPEAPAGSWYLTMTGHHTPRHSARHESKTFMWRQPRLLQLPMAHLGNVCCLYQQLWALHVREHFHQGTHERSIEL